VRILIARGMFVGQVYEKNFFFFFWKIGADLNARTLVGDTPLHYASRMGYETIVR
jgi:ankyrin repeat protein